MIWKDDQDGAELEAVLAPGDRWNIEASWGTLDATIDRLESIPLAVLPPELREGNKLPFAPRHPGARRHLLCRESRHVAHHAACRRFVHGQAVLRRGQHARDRAARRRDGRQRERRARGPSAAKWRITAGVNNATDELYRIAGNSSLSTGSGYAEVAYARPREYFATLTYDF